ncbi:hypothetical protein Tco_1154395 [Tanacetum coccineum]
MILYREGAGMTVNFKIALRHHPLPPKHTSSLIFPNSFTCSPENLDIVVCVSTSLALIDRCSMLKQCSNMISIEAPSSMCILGTRYPSTSASITKASSERSRARTGGKIIGTFIYFSTCLNSPCWVRLPMVPAVVSVASARLLRFLGGCLVMNIKSRMPLADGLPGWGGVAGIVAVGHFVVPIAPVRPSAGTLL